jgi:hypothetical protein
MTNKFMKKSILALILLSPSLCLAWGRRGHQTVAEIAAILVSEDPTAPYLKSRSFDFGYYANVPDIIWKKPSTYAFEKPQHFMDMEIYRREFKKKPEIKDPFALSRRDFEKAFPQIHNDAGRAFWRIRELNDQLEFITKKLRALPDGPESKPVRRLLQESWFLTAGVMAHYFGDLAQPLHVSENYDGLKTNQKGIHSFFEDDVVDELYPQIQVDVQKAAAKKWREFKKQNADKPVLDILKDLAEKSNKRIDPLLAIDKKVGRKNMKKAAAAYRQLIVDCMTDGTLALAEIYSRQTGWKYDGDRFFFFAGEPAYMMPGTPDDPIRTATK